MTQITIFTSKNCIWCERAKEQLLTRGYTFKEVDVLSSPEARDLFLKQTNGAKTVPQIFAGDHHIGGHDDLMKVIDTSKFHQLTGGQ